MKKTVLLILMAVTFLIPVLVNTGLAFSDNHYLAQVKIQSDLKPGFSPDTPDAVKQSKTGGVSNYILQMIAGGLIYLAGPTAILILAIGGLRYVTARGNQTQMDGAKKTVTYAIIGLIIIALSLAIVANVIRMFGDIPAASSAPASQTK